MRARSRHPGGGACRVGTMAKPDFEFQAERSRRECLELFTEWVDHWPEERWMRCTVGELDGMLDMLSKALLMYELESFRNDELAALVRETQNRVWGAKLMKQALIDGEYEIVEPEREEE